MLSAAFLRATRGWAVPKRVLNISSGLGRRAMAGQAQWTGHSMMTSVVSLKSM